MASAPSLFDRHFETYLADTGDAWATHHRLRYQVYCRDFGWEDAGRFPDQMERDEHDAESTVLLVRRRRTGAWVATMRFIRRPLEALPGLRFAPAARRLVPAASRERTVEWSRLCVVSKYRSRGGALDRGVEGEPDDSFLSCAARCAESWIFLGLQRAAWRWSLENGVDYWIFVISDALARIVRRVGWEIEPLGDVVDHRGPRRAYLFSVASGARSLETATSAEITAMFEHLPAYRRFSELPEHDRGVRRSLR